jgi:hypothetical protein
MKKQFWIMTGQFLLFLFLSQGIMAIGMIAALTIAGSKGLEDSAMYEYALSSGITQWAAVLGYVLTIVIFLGRRYVRVKLGRIERNTLWVSAIMATLIAWGWMFTEESILQLVDAERLFPDEARELEKFDELMSGPLGYLAVGILAPIAEEIGCRGVLMGGLLRMRCKPWVAIVVSALVFAYLHGTYLQLFGTIVFGIITGWLFWQTKSLIPGMIIHIVNNSTSVVLDIALPDYDPCKALCVILIVICLPILLIGLKWFRFDI